MSDSSLLLVSIILSFLFGSIPSGLIIGKIYGIDIRSAGSGNIGATNVLRTIGKKAGYLTFLFDMLKGLVPLIIFDAISSNELISYSPFVGLSAMLGHCFSPFLKFKGGKGVATGFAVFLYLLPIGGLISISIFILVFYLSRYVSLGSLISTSVFLFYTFIFTDDVILQASLSVATIILFLKHSANIKRLLKGEENRFKS